MARAQAPYKSVLDVAGAHPERGEHGLEKIHRACVQSGEASRDRKRGGAEERRQEGPGGAWSLYVNNRQVLGTTRTLLNEVRRQISESLVPDRIVFPSLRAGQRCSAALRQSSVGDSQRESCLLREGSQARASSSLSIYMYTLWLMSRAFGQMKRQVALLGLHSTASMHANKQANIIIGPDVFRAYKLT